MLYKITRTAKEISKALISAVTHPYYKLSYLNRTLKKLDQADGQYAIINLDPQLTGDDYGRYLYSMCLYFRNAGFRIVVKTYLRDFKNIRNVGFQENIWQENFIFIR